MEKTTTKKPEQKYLLLEKRDFKTKTVTRGKQGHYIMIKGLIQEDITIVNIYALNTGASKYMKQILTDIKGEIDSTT